MCTTCPTPGVYKPSSHSSSLPLTLLPHPGVCLSDHFQSTHLSTVSTMTQVGFFPKSRFGVGTKFTFQTPTSNTWTIRQKVSQHNHQVEEFDPDNVDFHVSESQATFFISNDSDPNGPLAYMRVYLQVPFLSTEFEPREVRSHQATQCLHQDIHALKFFHQEHATVTPPLLGKRILFRGVI